MPLDLFENLAGWSARQDWVLWLQVAGILLGAGLFAEAYPKLDRFILRKADFGELTLPQLFKVNPWVIIFPVAIGIILLLFWMERAGL